MIWSGFVLHRSVFTAVRQEYFRWLWSKLRHVHMNNQYVLSDYFVTLGALTRSLFYLVIQYTLLKSSVLTTIMSSWYSLHSLNLFIWFHAVMHLLRPLLVKVTFLKVNAIEESAFPLTNAAAIWPLLLWLVTMQVINAGGRDAATLARPPSACITWPADIPCIGECMMFSRCVKHQHS